MKQTKKINETLGFENIYDILVILPVQTKVKKSICVGVRDTGEKMSCCFYKYSEKINKK